MKWYNFQAVGSHVGVQYHTFPFSWLSLKSEKMSRISRPDSAQAYLLHHLPSYQRENRSQIIYAQDKASESHYVAVKLYMSTTKHQIL